MCSKRRGFELAGGTGPQGRPWAWACRLALVVLVATQGMAAPLAAAPLRLSLDSLAATGPAAEPVDPTGPAAPLVAEAADEDLSFVVAPDLRFPEARASASPIDEDMLHPAAALHDDASTSLDRGLGAFAPAPPPALAAPADPIDEVRLPSVGPVKPALQDKAAQQPAAIAPSWVALGWLAAAALVLVLAAAWRHALRRRPAARSVA